MSIFKVGELVDTDKGLGLVAYYGTTQFADGIWVGVILEEPKGKNNGTVKDVTYFKCEENYGIFVPRDKVRLRGDGPTPKTRVPSSSHIRAPMNVRKPSNTRIPSMSTLTTPSGTPRITPSTSMEKLASGLGIDRQKSVTKFNQPIVQFPPMSEVAETQQIQATPVNAIKDYEKTIKVLTEKNLHLEETICKLEEEIRKLEEMRIVDDEIFESQKDIERELREDKERYIKAIADLRYQFSDFDKCVQDYEHTIACLREKNVGLNEQIQHLQDELDAAMGSEETIATLTDKNLHLEETICKLEEEIRELEEMKIMDDEIIESQNKIERDLKEDKERYMMTIADLRRQLNDFDKCAQDYEHTIACLREKNVGLNEQIQHLQDEILILKAMEEEARVSGGADESISLRVVSANRTFSEIVDSELKFVELEFERQKSIYLKSFLPDNFSNAGGDNDCILLCIFFPRIIAKSVVLAKLLNLKYSPVPGGLRREHITRSHKAEQWAHIRKFNYSLKALISIARKFEFVLKNCSVEHLTRLAVQQLEITGLEKIMDNYFELLRANQLDENTSVDNIDRIINFLQKIYMLNVTADICNAKECLRDTIAQIKEGLSWNLFNCDRLFYFIQLSEKDDSEFFQFVTELKSLLNDCDTLTIRASNRIPIENDLILSKEMNEQVMNAVAALDKSAKLIHNTCSFAASQLATTDVDGFSSLQMKEMFHSCVERFVGTIDSHKASAILTDNIQLVRLFLDDISKQLENSSMEISPQPNKNIPPLLERAHLHKNDIVEAEGLRFQLSKKDEEIVRCQKLIKARESDISTLMVRLEMANKQLENNSGKSNGEQAQQISCANCTKLQETLSNLKREFEQKLADVNSQLRMAREERDRERESIRERTKNTFVHDVHQNIIKTSIASLNANPMTIDVSEMELLRLKKELFSTLNDLKWAEQRIRVLETQNARRLLNELEVIRAPDVVCGIESMRLKSNNTNRDDELKRMIDEVDKLVRESSLYLIEPVDSRERAKFDGNVRYLNDRIELLKFRFHRFWNRTHPGEDLPKLVKELFNRNTISTEKLPKPQQLCRSILDKWQTDLKRNESRVDRRLAEKSA